MHEEQLISPVKLLNSAQSIYPSEILPLVDLKLCIRIVNTVVRDLDVDRFFDLLREFFDLD